MQDLAVTCHISDINWRVFYYSYDVQFFLMSPGAQFDPELTLRTNTVG